MSRALSSLFQLIQSIVAGDPEAATGMQAARHVALPQTALAQVYVQSSVSWPLRRIC